MEEHVEDQIFVVAILDGQDPTVQHVIFIIIINCLFYN